MAHLLPSSRKFNLKRSPYSYWTPKLQEYVKEKHPDAVFVEEIALKMVNGGYTDNPGVVLYQENPPDPYVNKFFAYYKKVDVLAYAEGRAPNDQWVIVGLPTFDPVVTALLNRKTGDLMISRYRHDYWTHGACFIDGGRDYLRYGGSDMSNLEQVQLNLHTKEFEFDGAIHRVE